MSDTNWQTMIGLEIHVELLTKHKIFCSCSNRFGDLPNTNKCPICEGLPGAIPVFNEEVLELATKAGLILNCEINDKSTFDRKNYFYPDLPKGYQITQFYNPLCKNGHIDLPSGARIRISDIHMEDDAAKIVRENNEISVDYNRCGVPLIEIVTMPDFCSAEEVVEFLEIVRRDFQAAGISDCRIEQGSMRADVNLSVRREGEIPGVRTETKNMASFKAISKAIEYERTRQINAILSGETIIQETRRWDENDCCTYKMRLKENSYEYKYFPEPDIAPVNMPEKRVNEILSLIPELPSKKKIRYQNEFTLSEYEADILASDKRLIILFEEATAINGLSKENCNWILTHVLKIMNSNDNTISSTSFAKLISLVDSKTISYSAGRDILVELFTHDFDPESYARTNDLLMVSDDDLINSAIENMLGNQDNSKAISDYLGGNEKTLGFLMGKVMRILGGKADPSIVREKVTIALEKLK